MKGLLYQREAFISAIDQVLVIRLKASEEGAISFRTMLKRNRSYEQTVAVGTDTIVMNGITGGEHGIKFSAAARAIAQGGTVRILGETLIVDAADSVYALNLRCNFISS